MSGHFVKLYGSILDSSVWSEDPYTRLVWITMLAMADSEGFVEAALPGLARRANVPLEACERALERLMAPDPYSKSPENEGRRVEAVDRGWVILNYRQYRELRTPEQIANAERQARYKAKRGVTGNVTAVTGNAGNAPETAALSSTSTSYDDKTPSRADELSEVESCRATCQEYMALTGKELDEVLWEFSEFKGKRIVRLETAPLNWLRTTHDRIKAALIEARRQKASASQPKRETEQERIARLEGEYQQKLKAGLITPHKVSITAKGNA